MRFLFRSLLGLFLLALTLGLLALAGVSLKTAIDVRNAPPSVTRPAEERAFSARVVTLAGETIAPFTTAYGEVRSSRMLELRAAAAGQIVELAPGFADGARVEAGQLLVRVDPADAQSALALARTGLAEAEAEVRDAARSLALAAEDLDAARAQQALRQRALDRQNDIAGRGLGTAGELETAELALSSAQQSVVSRKQALAQAQERSDAAATSLDRQRLALAEAERRLAETELSAGFSGVLSGVNAVVGGLVAKTEKLGDLIDPDALEVVFRVSTNQFSRLIDADGRLRDLAVTAEVDLPGAALTARGKLVRVDAAVGVGLSGRLVFAELGAAPGFRPGDFVTVSIAEPPLSGVALVPARAVGSDGQVLVLGADNRLEAAPAEVLRRQGEDVLLRVGVLEGREIVAERMAFLGAGILVKPIRAPGAAVEPGAARADELVELTPERRAALIDFVENNGRMPENVKAEMLAQLRETKVPSAVISRIEARMGG